MTARKVIGNGPTPKESDTKKIQNHFGVDEIRDIVEKSIITRGLEPIHDKHYRELILHSFLFSYLNEEDGLIFVYFDYDEDNVEEREWRGGELISIGHYDRDLLLLSFFETEVLNTSELTEGW